MTELLVRKIEEAEGVVREVRDSVFNTSTKAVGGISEEITDLGKDLEREQDKAGTSGSTFVSSKDKVCRITSYLDGVR